MRSFKENGYDEAADVSPMSYAAEYLYDYENELGKTWIFPKKSIDEKAIDSFSH